MDDLCAMPRGQEWLHTRVTRCFRRTHWAFRVDIKLMVGVSKKIDEGYTYMIWRSNSVQWLGAAVFRPLLPRQK